MRTTCQRLSHSGGFRDDCGRLFDLYLDLVPPVPYNTLGDKLLLCGTITRNCFGIIPVNSHFHQIFFKCFAPDLSRPSSVVLSPSGPHFSVLYIFCNNVSDKESVSSKNTYILTTKNG